MPKIRVKENESPEGAFRRFKRACEKDGLVTELKNREYFIKPSEIRKRNKAAAKKRNMKKTFKDRLRAKRRRDH